MRIVPAGNPIHGLFLRQALAHRSHQVIAGQDDSFEIKLQGVTVEIYHRKAIRIEEVAPPFEKWLRERESSPVKCSSVRAEVPVQLDNIVAMMAFRVIE